MSLPDSAHEKGHTDSSLQGEISSQERLETGWVEMTGSQRPKIVTHTRIYTFSTTDYPTRILASETDFLWRQTANFSFSLRYTIPTLVQADPAWGCCFRPSSMPQEPLLLWELRGLSCFLFTGFYQVGLDSTILPLGLAQSSLFTGLYDVE